MKKPNRVAKVAEIPAGSMKAFRLEGVPVAVFHTAAGWRAIEDRCTHADVRLSDGWVDGNCVSCPWHGAQFDLSTGEALSGPAIEPTRAFEVQIVGDDVVVLTEEA